MLNKFFFLFVFIIIFSYSVLGLGVSPGVVNIDFRPNLITSFEMSVVNEPAKDQDVEIYVNLNGINESVVEEFRDIIILEKTMLSFTKNEGEKKIKVDLKFPEGFSKAGRYLMAVGAMPYVKGGQGLGIRSGNEIIIFVNVSDKYISPKYAKVKKLKILNIDAKSVKQGEKADINILVKSESDVALKEVNGKIKIISAGKELKTIQTDKVDINPGEEKTLKASLSTSSIQPSFLVLDIEIFYGSESVKGQGMLNVIGQGEGGTQVVRGKLQWWWILIIILIIFFLIIIFLLFLLLRKKKNENPDRMQKPGQRNSQAWLR